MKIDWAYIGLGVALSVFGGIVVFGWWLEHWDMMPMLLAMMAVAGLLIGAVLELWRVRGYRGDTRAES